jgi:hypothetical protein
MVSSPHPPPPSPTSGEGEKTIVGIVPLLLMCEKGLGDEGYSLFYQISALLSATKTLLNATMATSICSSSGSLVVNN